VLAILLSFAAGACSASDSEEVSAARPARCGDVSRLRKPKGMTQHYRLGPLRVFGFAAHSRAVVAAYQRQFRLVIHLDSPPETPITIRGRRCGTDDPMRLRAFGGRGAFSIPPHLGSAPLLGTTADLRAPNSFYVVYVFVDGPGKWRLDAWQGDERVGGFVLSVLRAKRPI
jgi:hypothetical protein